MEKLCLSFRLSVCLSGCFLRTGSLVFCEFQDGARNPYESQIFWKNIFCPIGEIGPKIGSSEFYDDNLCYFLCSCTNPIFGKNFVPEIAAFLN